jgi:hypothetical protein
MQRLSQAGLAGPGGRGGAVRLFSSNAVQVIAAKGLFPVVPTFCG